MVFPGERRHHLSRVVVAAGLERRAAHGLPGAFLESHEHRPGIQFGALLVIGKLRQAEDGASLGVVDGLQISTALDGKSVNIAKNDDVVRCLALNDTVHPGAMRYLVGIFLN